LRDKENEVVRQQEEKTDVRLERSRLEEEKENEI